MQLVTLSAEESSRGSGKWRFEKVVVVNPPSPPGYVANRDSHGGQGQLYPIGAPIPIPLDIPYLLAYLAERSISLDVLEAQGLDLEPEGLTAKLGDIFEASHKRELLIIVRIALCCLDWDLSVTAELKKRTPQAKIAVYGPIIPEIRTRIEREPQIDYIIRGEPEQTVFELMTGETECNIAGLAFRNGTDWKRNPDRPLLKQLDTLPFPKWELLPYRRYTLPKSSATAAVPYLPMLTSRGCPFGCNYCPYPVNQGLPFRYRTPINVVNEIEHLVRDLGVQYIIFRDPMFSLRQDRVVAICDEIRRRQLRVRWKCETRVDCLNESTIRAMAEAGCEGINFGIESADVQIQAQSGRKPIVQAKIIETVDLCRRLGIKTFAFFIIGLPGDTVETILGSLEFAVRLRPTWVQFNAASPLVGTKLREWAVARGLTKNDEYSYRTSHEAIMGNENLTREQVASLYKLAVFVERYLMNRGGILKDDKRTDFFYKVLRRMANFTAGAVAKTACAAGKTYWRRSAAAVRQLGQGAQ